MRAMLCCLMRVFDEFKALIGMTDERNRCERCEALGENDGAGTRATTAMGRRECLVQIDMHGVDTEIARARLAYNGVVICPVAVEIGPCIVHCVGDGDNILLEQPARIGICEHDRRNIRPEQGFD